MTTSREHLIRLVNEPDPLYYLLTHAEEIAWAIKEINPAQTRWEELKKRLDKYNAKIHCEDDGPCSGEFRAGFDRALGWVDGEIEKLASLPEVEES